MTDLLLEPSGFILITVAGFIAGFIDAIVGGGGMITIPTLLSIGIPPHITLGTNKLSSSFGSFITSVTYFRQKLFEPKFWLHSIYATFLGAISGSIIVNFISTKFLDKALPAIILMVALYSIFNRLKENDNLEMPVQNKLLKFKQYIQGYILGFYDGVAGPGTGAFWIISNMRLYKLNILLSSGIAKTMNFTSNIVSLAVFIYYGQVNWLVGTVMGLSLMFGSYIGARSAIYFGAKFIRPIFLFVVISMVFYLGVKSWFL